MPRGRNPLPDGMARTERITTKVRPAGKQQFTDTCDALGVTEADGARLAIEAWVTKHAATTERRSNR